MTADQKDLVFQLLKQGAYLRPRTRLTGTDAYMLYSGNQEPVKYYSEACVKKVRDVLKKDKADKMTLNLSLVRQLHGRNHIKKTYKLLNTKL